MFCPEIKIAQIFICFVLFSNISKARQLFTKNVNCSPPLHYMCINCGIVIVCWLDIYLLQLSSI